MYMYLLMLAGFFGVTCLSLYTIYKVYSIVSAVPDLPMSSCDQSGTMAVSIATAIMSLSAVIVSGAYLYGVTRPIEYGLGIIVSGILVVAASTLFVAYSVFARSGSIKRFIKDVRP